MNHPTLYDLKVATNGKVLLSGDISTNERNLPLGRVITNSGEIEPGDVFWTLKGPNFDGVDFVGEAFERGAVGAVVNKKVEAAKNGWVLEVENTQNALWQWAAWKRRQFGGTVIAVTGSVGKSTSRQMIQTILADRLVGSASPQNYNNHIGVPLSMMAMEPKHDYAILEMGASSPGEIDALTRLCVPKVGIITHVADAHLGGFGSRRGVAEAKGELLAALPDRGQAILVDDPWIRRIAQKSRAPITWVGRNSECDVVAEEIVSADGRLRFKVDGCDFSVSVWGRHHLSSALVAIAVAQSMGFDMDRISSALENFSPLPMRCEVIETRGATVINDTYNASPAAMEAALELLRDFDSPGRRIVVCGDMAELGKNSSKLHQTLGAQTVTVGGADLLIACGKFANDVVDGARNAGMPKARTIPCRSPEETLPFIGQTILPGDVLLVKGSRIMAMERLVNALQYYPQRRSA